MTIRTAILFVLSFIFFTLHACRADCSVFHTKDRVYIDAESFKANAAGDEFYLHEGHNVWLVTHSIHKDSTGLFAYENTLRVSNMEYERKWMCPYCYQYWPIGKPCNNPDCPSKYKS